MEDTSSLASPVMMTTTSSSSSSPKHDGLCKVCGDKASGKHYGVASCDGCRGFFKRSIRRNLEYVCKENGRCVVDVTRRNQCQACRFRKCLQVNMKRDAVQHERAPRSNQSNYHHHHHHHQHPHHYHPLTLASRLRANASIFTGLPLHHHHHANGAIVEPLPGASTISTTTTTTSATVSSALHPHYLPHAFFYQGMMSTFAKPLIAATTTANLGSPLSYYYHKLNPSSTTQHGVQMKEDEVSSSEEASSNGSSRTNINVEEKAKLELPLIEQHRRNMEVPLPLTLFPVDNTYETAARLLFLSIKWAKSIPSFLQLSYRDQSILLEESWSELFILTASQWSLPIDENFLVSNAVAPVSRQSALEEDVRKLREIINRLSLLRVDHTEHACLKALVLFKAECRGLCEPTHVELLQDQTHVMLHEYCSQKQTTHKARFGKLLLALPAVQSVSRRGLEELLFRQTVGDVSIERLLGNLAKATDANA